MNVQSIELSKEDTMRDLTELFNQDMAEVPQ